MLIAPLPPRRRRLIFFTAGEFWGQNTKPGLIFRGKNFNNAVIRQAEDEIYFK